jgi:hypothetical protein
MRATIPRMPHRTDRRGGRLPAITSLGLAAILVVAACGQSNPSASPSGSALPSPTAVGAATPAPSASPAASTGSDDAAADAIYDAVEEQVVSIRGLKPSHPVERRFITTAELRTLMTQQFDEDTPPAYLAANERLYKALGLIPATTNLRDLSLDLLSGGVAGFYRNDEGKLYVVSKSGQPGATERFYFSHEFDHALQDQNTTVFKDQDGILDQSDRLLARAAVYEGDATLLMTQWASANLSQQDLLEVISSSSDPAVQAVMEQTPAILRDTLTFPYTTGFGFVTATQSAGGWPAVDALFKRMPASTEQILHADKYRDGEAPVDVALPADLATRLGAGWSVPMLDTFGEYQLSIWLREAGVPAADVSSATAGWGGDRLAVIRGPDDAWSVVMQTAWDTEADAREFEAAATTALDKSGGQGRVLPGAGGKTRWVLIASDAETAGKVASALGLAG